MGCRALEHRRCDTLTHYLCRDHLLFCLSFEESLQTMKSNQSNLLFQQIVLACLAKYNCIILASGVSLSLLAYFYTFIESLLNSNASTFN